MPSSEKASRSSAITSRNSSPGTVAGKKKKSNKLVPPITIEDVFSQISTVAASILNPPLAHIVLTPRSAEVCLKYGVNPEVLKVRDIDSFWEPDIDPAIQEMRHEAYVQRRHEIMKLCRKERKKMVNDEFQSTTNMSPETVVGMTPEAIFEHQKQLNDAQLREEMARIEKIKKRQEKELEQMVEFEMTRAKIQQDMEKRLQDEKRREELEKRQHEKRQKLLAEEKRLRELQKAAEEAAEEERRRQSAHDMHDEELRLAEEQQRKFAEDKRRRREEELEKQRKHEEHKKQLQDYFDSEQRRLRDRLSTLHLAEEKKQAIILQRQREHAEELRHKRNIVEQRISRNLHMSQLIEEKRKSDFLEKQRRNELARQEQFSRMEEQRQLHIQEVELQEQRRQMILMLQKQEEQRQAELMLQKFETEDVNVHQEIERREKRLALLREKKAIRDQMKYENVDRVNRIQNYKRLSTLKKIEDSDSHTKEMLAQKQAMIEQHKRQAAEVRMQKERVAKTLDEMRANASVANKILTKKMAGVPLDKLFGSSSAASVGGSSVKKNAKRSKSADHLKGKTTSELLGLTPNLGPQSTFEGVDESVISDMMKGQGLSMTYGGSSSEPDPTPYVSPYQTIQNAPLSSEQ